MVEEHIESRDWMLRDRNECFQAHEEDMKIEGWPQVRDQEAKEYVVHCTWCHQCPHRTHCVDHVCLVQM